MDHLSQQTQTGQDVIFAIKTALVHEEVNGAFELGTLTADFYKDTREKMSTLSGNELADSTKALRKLTSKRIAKITRMASVTKLSQIVEVKLTTEEKKLFEGVNLACIVFKDNVKGEQNVKE
jgi:DNA replication initiation complex subunit (GINS family)